MKFDTIIIGAGLAGIKTALRLQAAGQNCALVYEGRSLHTEGKELIGTKDFEKMGGTCFNGDKAVRGEFEGKVLKALYTEKLSDVPLEADNYVLATGKFFGKGLVADMYKVYEPIFGLDVEFDPDRSTWFDPDFYAEQRFLSFGVRTEGGRAFRDGILLENVYAAGEILAGVSITAPDAVSAIAGSAELVATKILGKD